MSFNSWQFLIFLPVVILIHWILPHKARWIWLLLASYFFYAIFSPWLSFLILGTTLVSYLGAILIEKKPKWKKLWLVSVIVVCLGALLFFKYFEFLLNSVIDLINLFPFHVESVSLQILLPVGISFYTFQTLSYAVDVYRGDYPAEKHFGYYALFVSFFPQLIAGPIEKPGILLPQLKQERHFCMEDFLMGLRHLAFGFALKCLIADFIGVFVNHVYADLASANSLSVFLSSWLFLLEMYCDFGGYSEIAMGSSRMLSIRLSQNFDEPYLAESVSDFFRRWHYSLTRWFTQYVYIPLGGNQKGKVREGLNKLLVFALCGLWHGARWTYAIWGLYVGILAMLEADFVLPWLEKKKAQGANLDRWWIRWGRRLLLWLLFAPSVSFFRGKDIGEATEAFVIFFTGFGPNYFENAMASLGIASFRGVFLLVLLMVMVLFFRFVYRGVREHRHQDLHLDGGLVEKALSWNDLLSGVFVYVYAIIAIALMWILLISQNDASAFAYFQF